MSTTNKDNEVEPASADAPVMRLSWIRLGIAAAVAAGAVWGGTRVYEEWTTDDTPIGNAASVPYVDVTLTPTYPFQDPASNLSREIVLAFVVADPDDPCEPSWGGYYSLEEADLQLELARRIAQLRSGGGDVVVSFGGQANDELALGCTDTEELAGAYGAVVDHYDLSIIDLDIEGDELRDTESLERRAEAIALLQEERNEEDGPLGVWLTLPVSTAGFTAEGVAALDAMLAAGVDLSGVNAMTMNYGSADAPTADMWAATSSALDSVHRQLIDAYGARDVDLQPTEAWSRIGATPMIGQNDVSGEVFTLADATELATFAAERGLGRVSFWSLNRDAPCGSAFPDVAVLSNTCSGVEQEALGFATALAELSSDTPQESERRLVTTPDVVDDPETGPFPAWRPDAEYPEGYKVVRRGMVYEARWFTSQVDPASVSADPYAHPWTLLGPVGADDEPFTIPTVAPGSYPDWDPTTLYATGDRVLFDGLPYEARWVNQAESPETLFPVASSSAWEPLFDIPGEP